MTELLVERCDPRSRADGIKALFHRNDRSRFESVFDRIYRPRAEDGLRSWVGVQAGEVVMHISVSPQRFVGRGKPRLGGFPGDLMVDAPVRDFWNSVRLVRGMVRDVQKEGEIDFLLTTATEAAEPVFRAAGFKPLTTLHRMVLPLNPLYVFMQRVRKGARRFGVSETRLSEAIGEFPPPQSVWRPEPSEPYYRTRLPTSTHHDPFWLKVEGPGGHVAGSILVTGHSERPECNIADGFWESERDLIRMVLAAASWGRAHGYRKLVGTTPRSTRLGNALESAGFFVRDPGPPLLVRTFADGAVAPLEDWFVSQFAFGSW